MAIHRAPAVGERIDFDAAPYSTSHHAVVKAALHGHCTKTEASSVLSQRLEEAEESKDIEKIKGAMGSLKLIDDVPDAGTQGVCQFAWAKVSQAIAKRSSSTFAVKMAAAKEKATSITAV